MPLKWNAETGQYELEGEFGAQPAMAQVGSVDTSQIELGLTPLEQAQARQRLAIEQDATALSDGIKAVDNPPRAEGFGDGFAFGRDVLRGLGNAGTALFTDYVDLGLGLTDVAVQSGSLATGNGFDLNEVFNDADNPLTKARQDFWVNQTETQAGKLTSDLLRVGVALLTLPKTAISGVAKGAKLIRAGGVASSLMKLDKSLKAARGSQAVTKAAGSIADAAGVGKDAKRASKLIRDGDDFMRASFKELSQMGAEGNLLTDAWRASEAAVKSIAGKKLTFRSLGEALAWDAFVSFNIAGEGDALFDETFTDLLQEMGAPNLPFLQSDPLQSSLMAKLKQMTEGLLIGAPMEAVLSLAQLSRYAKAWRKASPAEKQSLLRSFDAEAYDLGSSIGKEYLDSLSDLPFGPTRPPQSQAILKSPSYLKQSLADNPALQQQRVNAERFLGGSMPSTQTTSELPMPLVMEGRPLLDDLLEAVETGRIQNELTTETQSNLREWGLNADIDRRMAEVADRQAAERIDRESIGVFDNEPATAAFNRPERPASVIDPGQPQLAGAQTWLTRPAEPTVTPTTFAAAWKDYVQKVRVSVDGPQQQKLLQEGMVKLERLLPPGRVDGIDWMDAMGKDLNEAGVIQATNSLAANRYLQQGLTEGWASIDPETGFAQFNRKLAFDFDKSEAFQKRALKEDEALEVQQFNKQADGAEGDPGVTENLRQAGVDDVKGQQFDAQEAAELDAAALAGIGDDPDSVLVAEMLGQRLDQLPAPTIEKLGARKYGLVDETGEVLEQFTTLKQAKKSLEAEQGRIREAAIARAKRMRDNATDQPQVWTPGGLVGESDVVGKIKFTKTQLKFLEDRGMKLPGTNYELSQTQMSEFAKGLRTLADSGQFVGQQKKMLNNMIDRLDVQVKTLEPMARARRIVNDTVQKANKIIDNGEICL